MSAISRELTFALQNHPNALTPGGNVLLCVSETDITNNDLKEDLNDFFDGTLEVEEMAVEDLIEHSEKEEKLNDSRHFDGIICSNIFTETNIVEDRRKVAAVLGVLLRMLRNEGAVLIIRENLEHFSAQLIADLTKFVDVLATKCQSHTLGFRLYGMCQKFVYNVASYEWIFGKDFISPGGIEENRRVLRRFRRLRPGQKMLDIGVGIGGGARQAAREFGLQVLGCDLSSNMIQHAFERNQRDKDHRVEYQIADAMVYRYEPNAYDIVFSRDCIQHIQDTKALFRNIYTWLKPGGQLLLTMYGKGLGVLQPKFHEYVRKRQYMLKTLDEYRETAHGAGFTNIFTENMTPRLRTILEMERSRAIAHGDEFVQRFGKALYDKLLEGWMDKLQFIDDDNQNWLMLRAEKPVHSHAYLTEAGA
uniref:phosphoethanolamine N-methyltransferase n=1 Tax=Globodera rostochiensis TaxID=31243 RepID=A0A914HG47_GLORO